MNFYQLTENIFAPFFDKIFLTTHKNQKYAYRNLMERTAQYANLLLSLGLSQGDRVAVQTNKSVDNLFLYLACLRAGLIYLPLNTAYKESELEYFFTDAEPKLIVCSPTNYDTVKLLTENKNILIETLNSEGTGSLHNQSLKQQKTFDTVSLNADSIAVILYTSGTTGKPKGAMLSHQNLAVNGLALKNYWGFTQKDILLHMLPIFHVHGLFFATHCVLLSAASMYFIPKFTLDNALAYLKRSTVMMGVPTYYIRLLEDIRLNKDQCKTMRLFISGSAPLLEKTFYEFQKKTGHSILERYGMTETGINTSNPLHGERIPGTVGFPLPDSQLRVVDNNDSPLNNNEIGNIQVKGNNVFKGYWKKPEKTAAEFTACGFFRTGDKGKIDDNGYVSITGRAKDMIISGALNIYPKEVEDCINQINGIKESAVIGLPHHDFGEAVTAIIVRENNACITESVINIGLKNQLANFKVPKGVIFVNELPRNTMGKVQKFILREQYKSFYTNIVATTSTDKPIL